MHPQEYYKDATEMVLELMRKNFGDKFRAYFEGDPYDIPVSLMPCMVVSKQTGTSNPGPTGTQDVTEEILVQVVLNKADDFGSERDLPNIDLTNRKLRILCEGRDKLTARYLDDSVCGILAKNFTIGGNVLEMNIATAYPLTERNDDMLTQEAHVTLNIRERIIIKDRQ